MEEFTKRIITLLIMVLLFSSSLTSISANNSNSTYIDEVFEDVSYIEIVIEEHEASLTREMTTKTARKTAPYKDSNGNELWTFYVSGIFKYDGTTSICTSSVVNASSLNTNWKIYSKSATKSNATASATCTAKQYTLGICVKTVTRNLSLTCSPNGTLS